MANPSPTSKDICRISSPSTKHESLESVPIRVATKKKMAQASLIEAGELLSGPMARRDQLHLSAGAEKK